MQEFLKRIRIAAAILVGYLIGRLAADRFDQNWSEVFSAGFLFGVLATQGLLTLFLRRFGSGAKSS